MKYKYTVKTSQGIITRKGVRKYTHVVVAGIIKESVVRDWHARSLINQREQLISYQAEMDAGYPFTIGHAKKLAQIYTAPGETEADIVARQLAEAKVNYPKWLEATRTFIANEATILAESIKNRRPLGLAGFTGRLDLAQKLAAKTQVEYENVEIVAITDSQVVVKA